MRRPQGRAHRRIGPDIGLSRPLSALVRRRETHKRGRAALARRRSESSSRPPRSRASSRLIERPRPVPPYCRLVEPSACWKASKMILLLVRRYADARIGHRKRDRVGVAWFDPQLDRALAVNLKALASRFFRISRVASRRCAPREAVPARASMRNSSFFAPPPGGRTLDLLALYRSSGIGARCNAVTATDLDLGEIEQIVDQARADPCPRRRWSARSAPACR